MGWVVVLPKFLPLLLVIRRVPADIRGFPVEEIRHEDLVLVLRVGVGEDIRALQGLGEEAEDVVDV